MSIDKRSLVIGACVGIIIIASIGLANAISYQDKLDKCEDRVLQRESTIRELESINAQLEEELLIKESNITEMEGRIILCKENCSQLKAIIVELDNNNSALVSEIELLDRAVHMVGQEDIRELLWAYTEVSMQYEDLQRKYDELQLKYYKLLSSTP